MNETSKTLKAIQVLAKIGKVLSKIVNICCIVGFCLCAVGIICLALMDTNGVQLGGVTIQGVIEANSGMSKAAIYTATAAAAVFTAAEAVLSQFAYIYFKRETDDGTPFTKRGAKELMRLGILAIVLPVCAAVICSIGVAAVSRFYPDVAVLQKNSFTFAGLGVMFIVSSLFCRYGAELKGNRGEDAIQ